MQCKHLQTNRVSLELARPSPRRQYTRPDRKQLRPRAGLALLTAAESIYQEPESSLPWEPHSPRQETVALAFGLGERGRVGRDTESAEDGTEQQGFLQCVKGWREGGTDSHGWCHGAFHPYFLLQIEDRKLRIEVQLLKFF